MRYIKEALNRRESYKDEIAIEPALALLKNHEPFKQFVNEELNLEFRYKNIMMF